MYFLCNISVIFTLIAIALLMTWKDDEKAYAVETFFRTGSYAQTMLSFRKRFNVLKSPNKSRIAHWVKKFRVEGTVQNRNSGRSGRRRHGRSQENIDIVSASVDASPDTSIRRRIISLDIDISYGTAWRILKRDLFLTAFVISMRHELTERDMVARVTMCQRLDAMMRDDPNWIQHVWFSDESNFHLCGRVNKTHCIFWGTSKPDRVIQRPFHSQKCIV